MGRFQNPWMEVDIKRANAQGVPVIRRKSGGGTVYHDQGNLNLSFIADKNQFNIDHNFQFVLDRLHQMKIPASVNERRDIVIDGLKISGSAFKNIKDYSLHHLTLLFSTSTELIKQLLHHPRPKIESRSILSKRSEMTTIREHQMDLEAFKQLSKSKVSGLNSAANIREIDLQGMKITADEFPKYLADFKSPIWQYGEIPQFSLAIEINEKSTYEFRFKKGKLQSIEPTEGSDNNLRPEIKDYLSSLLRFFSEHYWTKESWQQFESQMKDRDKESNHLNTILNHSLAPL